MPKAKIDRVKLNQMLHSGKSQKEVAQFFGVSEGAISKAKKELNINVVKNVGLETAHQVIGKGLNAVEQLTSINRVANKLLDELTGEDRLIDHIVNVVGESLELDNDPRKQRSCIKNAVIQINQDRGTALKACAEIRNQLSIQLDIFKTMCDLETVREFQLEVLSAIGEVSKETRDAIIRRLKKSGLYEDLFQSLERRFKSSAAGNNGHLILMDKDETEEEARRRYFEETGRSIDEQDLEIFVKFIGTPPRGAMRGSLAE